MENSNCLICVGGDSGVPPERKWRTVNLFLRDILRRGGSNRGARLNCTPLLSVEPTSSDFQIPDFDMRQKGEKD